MNLKKLKAPLSILLLFSMLSIVGCKEDEKTQKTITSELLTSKQWGAQSVVIDGVDKTNLFTGLKVTFTTTDLASGQGTYTSVNGGAVWPASGTWSLTDDTGESFLRSDQTEVQIDELTDTKLVVRITWTTTVYGPGRMAGVHVFTFQ